MAVYMVKSSFYAIKTMVRRSERVLESRIRPMKSNKDDHILMMIQRYMVYFVL